MKALYGKQVVWCYWSCYVSSDTEEEYCVPSESSYLFYQVFVGLYVLEVYINGSALKLSSTLCYILG